MARALVRVLAAITALVPGLAPMSGPALAAGLVVLPRGQVPPPIPPTPPIVVGPYAGGVPIVCTARDVAIRADNIAVVLRGGCRSVSVDGGRVTVTAELEPGATLWLGSAGVVVNYALVGRGPPPVVRLTAAGLHATHIERLGEAALSLPVPAAIGLPPY